VYRQRLDGDPDLKEGAKPEQFPGAPRKPQCLGLIRGGVRMGFRGLQAPVSGTGRPWVSVGRVSKTENGIKEHLS
jgi:hypothetical protein